MDDTTGTRGRVLWRPPADAAEHTRIGAYLRWLAAERGRRFPEGDYDALWRWSVDDLDGFWRSVWDHFALASSTPVGPALADPSMPGARWFPGVALNYATHALRHDTGGPALVGLSQSRPRVELGMAELRDRVARCRAGLARLGVGRGDRVAAYLPNIPETVVAFLAAAGLGAVWSSCAPEFGTRSVVDRLRQIEPTVLLAVDGYRYGARTVDRAAEVAAIRAELPSLRATVTVPYLDPGARLDGTITWDELLDVAHGGRPAGVESRSTIRSTSCTRRAPPAAQGHRPRARRHPGRAPQGAGPAQRPGAGRPLLLVLHHRLDDVELPGVGPAGGGHPGAVRRRPRPPRPGGAVAAGRGAGDVLRDVGPVPAGLPQGGDRAVGRGRPVGAAAWGRPGAAAGRGLRVGLRGGGPGRAAVVGERGDRRVHRLRGRLPAGAGAGGEISCRYLGARSRRSTPAGARWWGSRASWSSPPPCRRCRWGSGATPTGPATGRPTSRTIRGLDPRRLDHGVRGRCLRDHRPVGRHPQPGRRADGHRRAVLGGGGPAGGGRQPGGPPRGPGRRARAAAAVRGPGPRAPWWTTTLRGASPPRCAASCRPATCPTRSTPCPASPGPCRARSWRCRSSASWAAPTRHGRQPGQPGRPDLLDAYALFVER